MLTSSSSALSQTSVSEVFTEHRKNPLGLDRRNLRFSGPLSSKQRNTRQWAYEVQVTDHQGTSPDGSSSAYGQRPGERLALKVTVPVNTTSEVFVPTGSRQAVTERNQPLAKRSDIEIVGQEEHYSPLKLKSTPARIALTSP